MNCQLPLAGKRVGKGELASGYPGISTRAYGPARSYGVVSGITRGAERVPTLTRHLTLGLEGRTVRHGPARSHGVASGTIPGCGETPDSHAISSSISGCLSQSGQVSDFPLFKGQEFQIDAITSSDMPLYVPADVGITNLPSTRAIAPAMPSKSGKRPRRVPAR
jgi:hypothetical protein